MRYAWTALILLMALVLTAPPAASQSNWPAGKVLFTDADDLQEKFDAGELGGSALSTVTCTSNVATIGSTTGVYRVTTGCVKDDTIVIPNLSTFAAGAVILMTIVNDSGVDMVVDASANTTVVNEANDTVILSSATFSVVQTAASTVHIIGTGAGGVMREVPSVASITSGFNAIMTGEQTGNNTIDPLSGNSVIASPCPTDKPCIIGDTAATSPVPNFAAAHNGGVYPVVPQYDSGTTYRIANYSGIWPGSYDNVIQTQAGLIGGNHNLIGPQDAGTGHVTIIGSRSLNVGESEYASIFGSQNWIWLRNEAVGTSSAAAGITIVGKGNYIDSALVLPSRMNKITMIGGDNLIKGTFSDGGMIGNDNTWHGDETAGALARAGHWFDGCSDCEMNAPDLATSEYPHHSKVSGSKANAWLTGQTVEQSLGGYDCAGTTCDIPSTLGQIQIWDVVVRRTIEDAGDQDLWLEPTGGGFLRFGSSAIWNWTLNVTCFDKTNNLDTGADGDPSFAAWYQQGVTTFIDHDNSPGNRSMQTFFHGTAAAPTDQTGAIGADELIDALIEVDEGTGTPSDWRLEFDDDPANGRIGIAVDSGGDDINCTGNLHVIEHRT